MWRRKVPRGYDRHGVRSGPDVSASVPANQVSDGPLEASPGEVTPVGVEPEASDPAGSAGQGRPGRRSLMDRADTFISRLSTRNNFWHRVCSLIWLPYAFKSGIRMKRVDANTFAAVLPFRRFNRNWYNAMAGAALLANSEISGGMYLFALVGGEYTVVCKALEYKFLRPCFGPALYRITPREEVSSLLKEREFNVTLDLEVVQQLGKRGGRDRRVGKCTAVFHVTRKTHQQTKGRRIRP